MPLALRPAFRLATRRAMHNAIHSNPHTAAIQQRLLDLTPRERQSYAEFLAGEVRDDLVAWIGNWLAESMRSWWQPAELPAGSGGSPEGGPSKGDDPPEMTVDKLVELIQNGKQYVVHRTPSPTAGTLRDDVIAKDPAGDSPHAARGVYVMRGVSGVPNGDWGVVYLYDGRFKPYSNAEYVCTRTLSRTEAVGWYHVTTLLRAQAVIRANP